jgi:hypothetical protein
MQEGLNKSFDTILKKVNLTVVFHLFADKIAEFGHCDKTASTLKYISSLQSNLVFSTWHFLCKLNLSAPIYNKRTLFD